MTDTITSQNTDLSSWDTLYNTFYCRSHRCFKLFCVWIHSKVSGFLTACCSCTSALFIFLFTALMMATSISETCSCWYSLLYMLRWRIICWVCQPKTTGMNRIKIKLGWFHTGYRVVDPRGFEPQTRDWFGRTHVAFCHRPGLNLCDESLHIKHVAGRSCVYCCGFEW
jgi:hypothetical protein